MSNEKSLEHSTGQAPSNVNPQKPTTLIRERKDREEGTASAHRHGDARGVGQ